MVRCRHERNSWIIACGRFEWCYVCGAIRRMKRVGDNEIEAETKWKIPTGDHEVNPWPMVDK